MLDSSAVVEYLLRTDVGLQVGSIIEAPDSDLNAPEICDVEIASALRRMIAAREIDEERADPALLQYAVLPIERHRHLPLLRRIFGLRENFTAADAAYVALCERLDATLVTCDLRLTRAVRQFLPLNVVGVGA